MSSRRVAAAGKKKKKKAKGGRSPRAAPREEDLSHALEAPPAVDPEEADRQRRRERRAAEERRAAKEKERQRQEAAAAAEAEAQRRAAADKAQAGGDDDDDDDNYDDDDFDDDDFEDLDEPTGPSPLDQQLSKNKPAIRKPGVMATASMAPPVHIGDARSMAAGGKAPVRSPRQRYEEASSRRVVTRPQVRNVAGILHPKAKRVDFVTQRVEMSEDYVEVFAQAPLPPYDVYLNRLRSALLRQTASQTNHDATSVECQTETTPWKHAGMQFPDDVGVGSSKSQGGTSLASQQAEALRLFAFLRRTSAVMECVLDENIEEAESKAAPPTSDAAGGSLFVGFPATTPSTLPFIEGRRIVATAFSEARPNDMLVAYSEVATPERSNGSFRHREAKTGAAEGELGTAVTRLAAGGLLCLWDLNDVTLPRIPDRSHVAVAGMEDGSVALWDLREPVADHVSADSTTLGLPSGLRQPSYSTESLPSEPGQHVCRICDIVPLSNGSVYDVGTGTTASEPEAGAGEGSAGDTAPVVKPATTASASSAGLGTSSAGSRSSFQVASVDDRGLVNVWVAVEITGSDLVDPGLRMGASIKLVKTSTIHVYLPTVPDATDVVDPVMHDADNVGPSVECIQFCDSNRFLVATSSGAVLNRARFGGFLAPVAYFPADVMDVPITELPASYNPAVALDFCPWSPSHFLVGYIDGVVALFSSDSSQPVASWDLPRHGKEPSVLFVRWARCSPGVFFVVDATGGIHVWNLLLSDKAPVLSQAVELPGGSVVVSASSSDSRRRPRKANIAVAVSIGSVAAFTVSPHVLLAPPDAPAQLRSKLTHMLG